MKIEQLFSKQLNRDINGVVKAEETKDSVVLTELDEYVVTNELDKHFRSFFESYLAAIENPDTASQKVGVWISGFFGSGKSHFLKILSYLLENRVVASDDASQKLAIDFFKDKIADPLLYGDIHRSVKRPTEVILFNIDSRANTDDRDNAILKVFLKVFNDRVGYCAEHPHVAHLERELDKKGQYTAFKEKFNELSSSKWEAERDAYEFYQDEMVQALSAATGQSVESSTSWFESLKNNFPLSILNFSKWVAEYLNQTKEKNLLFLVDEVGQFIGKNSQMMLQLQTIVETMGVETQGRAWVVVTAQADIDAAIGQLNKNQGDDFSKIQGRFLTRMQLSSSNTAEVIQKRLLSKTPEALEVLSSLYASKQDILKNQLSFNSTASLSSYSDITSFVDNYPFIPYHYGLVQKVFESIRTKGATGKHLAMGERSLLDAFQSAAKQISLEQAGALIPFDRFYTPIESFLEPAVKRTIDQAVTLDKLTEFDSRLLKTLFLIRYVDTIKSTVENLATLMVDEIDANKLHLKKEIESSLLRLENELLIARNGEEYNFLTNEEKEIENEIRHTDVEPTAINNKLAEILFDTSLKGYRAYRYPINKQEFKISRFCNGHPRDGSVLEDLVVRAITPLDMDYDRFQSSAYCNQYSLDQTCLLILLGDNKSLWDDMETYVKTERYLKQTANSSEKAQLLREKHLENNDRLKRLHQGIEQLISEADYYAIGAQLQTNGSSPVTQIEAGCKYIIENTFAKLALLQPYPGEINHEIQSVLNADDVAQIGLDLDSDEVNPQANKEVENYIGLKLDRSEKVYIKNILEHFAKRPYGWPESEVVLLIARLALAGKISFVYQANPLNLKQAYEPLNNFRKRAEVQVLKVRRHDDVMLSKAKKLYKDLFIKTFTGTSEKELAEAVTAQINYRLTQLKEFKSKSQALHCPGIKEIENGLVLIANLVDQPNSFALIQSMIDQSEELLDFSEDFEDLDNFYNSQFQVWKTLNEAINIKFKANRSAIEKDDKALQALQTLESIYNMDSPYNQLKNIAGLIETVNSTNEKLIAEKRKFSLSKVEERIHNIQQQLEGTNAPDELKNKALIHLQACKKRIQQTESIPEIMLQQQETAGHEEDAEALINEYIQKLIEQQKQQEAAKKSSLDYPTEVESGKTSIKAAEPSLVVVKPVKNIAASSLASDGFIESPEQADVFIETLREQLLKAINAGERVRIK
ncbi:BREX system P-loop protein BrxC [Hydrogenovibrio sp. SC-1]|uniref:BREX system P-loop protein BrxC n=1 Tax=Hydrogenovibrio sp. SC-1 TaxID=2065820 RepID=UPI000C7B74E2|nr:BREX system P-loop protein BrxC [Hydrogenovibrio sp. SC-1]PLA74870.1 BREX system P-loop protein BrxC [Hydrogenovibrio sp. SC-1]